MHTKENPHMYMAIYWHIHVCIYVCVFVKHKTKGESRESEKEKKNSYKHKMRGCNACDKWTKQGTNREWEIESTGWESALKRGESKNLIQDSVCMKAKSLFSMLT